MDFMTPAGGVGALAAITGFSLVSGTDPLGPLVKQTHRRDRLKVIRYLAHKLRTGASLVSGADLLEQPLKQAHRCNPFKVLRCLAHRLQLEPDASACVFWQPSSRHGNPRFLATRARL